MTENTVPPPALNGTTPTTGKTPVIAEAGQRIASQQHIECSIDDIAVGRRLRALNVPRVEELAESIKTIGLQSPISVRVDATGKAHLVAGLHRLQAARDLGWKMIPAVTVTLTGKDLKRWEIAENLHRAELTALERSRHIDEWMHLTDDKSAQVAQVSSAKGGRGKKGGMSEASRELGIGRDDVRRAGQIASLPLEVQQLARDLHLDDNQSALLGAARHREVRHQLQSLKDWAPSSRARALRPYRCMRKDVEDIHLVGESLKDGYYVSHIDTVSTAEAGEWDDLLTEALPIIEKYRDACHARRMQAGAPGADDDESARGAHP